MGRQLKKKVLERPLAVVKRKHFERGCQYIARRWLVDDYAKISAKDLVRLGIYATPRDLQQYSTQEILRAIGEQVKESFLHEYLWYIHAVEGSSNLAVAVYEGAVHIAADSLPTDKRDEWSSLCRDSLTWLRANAGEASGASGTNDADEAIGANDAEEASGANDAGEIHSTTNSIIVPTLLDDHPHYSNYSLPMSASQDDAYISPASQLNVDALIPPLTPPKIFAKIAKIAVLRLFVSQWIMGGLSATRYEEASHTDHVRLGLPFVGPADVELEIDLPAWQGKEIYKANERSVEELKRMLGSGLFGAMEDSCRRTAEGGKLACTSAVRVSFQDGSEVCTLTVDMEFYIGVAAWKAVYA